MNDIERQKNRAFIATLSCIAFIINTSAACVRYGMETRREASAPPVTQATASQQPSSVARAAIVQTVLPQPAVTYSPPLPHATMPAVPPPQSASVPVVYVVPKASSDVSPPKRTMAAEAEPDSMKTMPMRSDDRRQASSDSERPSPVVADSADLPDAQETSRETPEPPKEHPHFFDSFLYVTLSPVRILLKPIQPGNEPVQRTMPTHRNSAKAKAAVPSKASAPQRAKPETVPVASPNQIRHSVKK
jgi:hypothetical protein